MRDLLSLLDVSPYVYTGMESSLYNTYSVQGYPIGGIKYFLRYFTLKLTELNDVACFFDSSTDRKDWISTYKSNRISNHSVYSQLEFLYEYLLQSNIPAYKVDGYEADDLIYSAVEQNYDEYFKILILSADYDLTHSVDFKVSFEAINSRVNDVDINNFSNSVQRGVTLMRGTISAYKVFCGDASDKIPVFNSSGKLSGMELYQRYCDFISKVPNTSLKLARDKRALLLFIHQLKSELSPTDISELESRIMVIYPRKVEGIKIEGAGQDKVNLDKLARLLSICGEYQGLRMIGRYKTEISEEEIEMFRRKARELRTGEFAADRLLRLDGPTVDSEILNMRSF